MDRHRRPPSDPGAGGAPPRETGIVPSQAAGRLRRRARQRSPAQARSHVKASIAPRCRLTGTGAGAILVPRMTGRSGSRTRPAMHCVDAGGHIRHPSCAASGPVSARCRHRRSCTSRRGHPCRGGACRWGRPSRNRRAARASRSRASRRRGYDNSVRPERHRADSRSEQYGGCKQRLHGPLPLPLGRHPADLKSTPIRGTVRDCRSSSRICGDVGHRAASC